MGRGSTQDRRSARHRRVLATCLLALLVLPGAAGCGDSGADDAAERRRAAAAARLARELPIGRRVFAEHCQACHTLAGKRYTGPIIEFEAPNLDEVRMRRTYVEWRVEYGGPAMAAFWHELGRRELSALITYVTETAGGDVVDGDPPAATLAQGREVFAQHCAACHGIAGREATGDHIYHGMDFNLMKPSPRYVEQIARRGILPEGDLMPSFRGRLRDAEIEAVAAYVNAVAMEGPEAPRTPFRDLRE